MPHKQLVLPVCCIWIKMHRRCHIWSDLWEGGNRLSVWGHMPLGWPVTHEFDGRDCWCGRTGCLESFIFAKGFEACYLASTKTALTIDEIAIAASQNNIIAESVYEVLDDRVGLVSAHPDECT